MRNIFGNPVNTISDLKKVYQDGVPYNCKYRIEINFPPSLQTTLNAENIEQTIYFVSGLEKLQQIQKL